MIKSELVPLWRFRYFLSILVARNIKLKYQQSWLGLLWTIINPLMILAILLTVFTRVIRIQIEDYWAFLVTGYFVYHFVSQATLAAASVLDEYAVMIRSVAVPRSATVLAAITSRFLEFLLEFTLALLVVVVFHHHALPLSILWVPLLVFLMFMLTAGLSLMISALAVFYYDVRHMLPIALTALFYISPVVYSVNMVPEQYHAIYYLNPLAVLLDLLHATVYAGTMPPTDLFVVCVLQTSFILWAGVRIFRHFEPQFAEVL
ncbi:MAG: ABC transporter permease [Pseudomonadota bacterium]|nr:ABC transporter permease [Pseudomonadota bacterium]